MPEQPVLVDSHCHLDRLDLSKYDGLLSGALDKARDNGIERMLCVSIDLENYPMMMEQIEPYDQIYASVGVHPNETEGHDPDVDELVELAKHPKIVAIGETGLDYFRGEGDLEWQRDRFRTHIRAAIKCGKPLIIHSRDAKQDTIRILEEENAKEIGGVMHCFTEDWDMAQKAMAMNFYISFSGIVTFKNAVELKDVAKRVPMDRMLVETDSPYLAPIPYRGKPNEPAYVLHVAEHIAELRDIPLEVIAEQTTRNFHKLFKIDS